MQEQQQQQHRQLQWRGVPPQIQRVIEQRLPAERTVNVLEAGCGMHSRIVRSEAVHITGVDISAEDLSNNKNLDERVAEDLNLFTPPADAFDIVICWDVLEHLTAPTRVLESLVVATRSGGVILLAAPNLMSWKGLITKLTPHRFHDWVYSRFAGFSTRAPFKTTLKRSIAPRALLRWARRQRLAVECVHFHESYLQTQIRSRLRLTGGVWSAICALTKAISIGRVSAEQTDFVLVLRKP